MVKPYQGLRFVVVLIFSILIGLSHAAYAEGPVLTIVDAIFLALRYNPNIQSGEFKRITDKFSLRISQYNFEWQLAMTGDANFTRTTTQGVTTWGKSFNFNQSASINNAIGGNTSVFWNNNSDGSRYNPSLGFNITQPLVKGFGSAVTLAPLFDAYDNEKVSRMALRQTIMDVVESIILNYRAYVSAQNSFKIQLRSLKRAQETVKNTIIQIKAGNVAPAERVTAELNAAQLQLSIIQQENAMQQAREALLTAIGLEPSTPIIVPLDVPDEKFEIPPQAKCIELALRNDTSYLTSLLAMEQAKRALLIARDNARWTVNMTASSTFNADPNARNRLGTVFNGRNNSQNLAFNVVVPINHLPLEQAISNAETSIEQQKIALLTLRRGVITNVINGIRNIETLERSITQSEQQRDLAIRNVHNAMLQFRYGRTSMFEFTQKQDELTNAELNVLISRIAYLNAVSTFEKILGISLDRWGIKIRY